MQQLDHKDKKELGALVEPEKNVWRFEALNLPSSKPYDILNSALRAKKEGNSWMAVGVPTGASLAEIVQAAKHRLAVLSAEEDPRLIKAAGIIGSAFIFLLGKREKEVIHFLFPGNSTALSERNCSDLYEAVKQARSFLEKNHYNAHEIAYAIERQTDFLRPRAENRRESAPDPNGQHFFAFADAPGSNNYERF